MPAPTPTNSVRASVINNELDRIQHRSRPHFSNVPTEDYLNSRAVVNFDDDVRNIRAHTAALLKRVQSPIPRAPRMPLSSAFDHIETAIPDRITSDAYISTMLSPRDNVNRIVEKMTHYPDIHDKAYHNIGSNMRAVVIPTRHRVSSKGRLACVSFAGGKAYPRRKHIMVSGNGDETRNVKADINFLSYYNKARNAANDNVTQEIPLQTSFQFRRSPEPTTPRSYYRLIRPYNKSNKTAPAKVEADGPINSVEDNKENEVTISFKPKKAKRSLSRQETFEREREEAERLAEQEKRREEEAEAERLAEAEILAAEREEQERIAEEERKAEEERLAAERERLEAEREEARRLAEIAEEERLAAEKAEEERIALEKAEEERLAREEEERVAAEEAEREKLEAERLEEERLEAETIRAEQEAEEERIRAAQAEEERYTQEQGGFDERKLAAELTANLLRIKAEKEREEANEEEETITENEEERATDEPEKDSEYVSDEDNDKAVAESSEDEEEAKDQLGDEGNPIVEYPITPDVHEKKSAFEAEEVDETSEEEEEEE